MRRCPRRASSRPTSRASARRSARRPPATARHLPAEGASGILYLDSTAASRFTREDLRLAAGLAELGALALSSLRRSDRRRLDTAAPSWGEMVGEGAAMRHVAELIEKVART